MANFTKVLLFFFSFWSRFVKKNKPFKPAKQKEKRQNFSNINLLVTKNLWGHVPEETIK